MTIKQEYEYLNAKYAFGSSALSAVLYNTETDLG